MSISGERESLCEYCSILRARVKKSGMKISFLFLASIICCILVYEVKGSTCGYEACPEGKPDMLNVHLICHTHDDVGWLHTVDTYYEMWVKDIISSVVSNLVQDENRKFSYVEIAFFSKWWSQQTDLVKEYVTRLVNDGRLEFVSGGWSMNDEATTHYVGIIDQMTLGLRWLNETFGKCASPRVGWQIDTFGHSREQASLLAQMGFEGMFIGRIHYQDKFWRQKTKTMEVLWQASQSLGEKSNIFTGVLPNVYWPPRGFCFDVFCGDEELTEDNINMKGHKFISLAEEQAKLYASNHIPITMGMDFHFRDAAKWYRNLDFLIQHINSLQAVGIKVNVFYSSPTCYLNSLNKANVTWPTINNDFFPYASKQHEYWTGYFTSRPAFKYYCRRSSSFLQACKQLITLSDLEDADSITLHKALGVVQHHDGITGTEKQHVVIDYIRQLSKGTGLCQDAIVNALLKLMTVSEISYYNQPKLNFCEHLNMSQCQFTELENEFSVIVYNPLSHYRRTYIRLPVLGEGYNITDITRGEVPVTAQIIPISLSVINLVERLSLASNELVFPVTLPPLGVSVFDVRTLQDYEPVLDIESAKFPPSVQDAIIGNEYYEVKIDGHTGLVKEISILPIGIKVPLRQSFYYYEGMPGYRIERASGAYAFNPQYDLAFALGENVTYRIFKGSLVEEVHQYFTPWISQVIRIYKGQPHVEFDWVIGPIPVHDHIGREIISRFDTTLNTNNTFYTDSNGRETIKRVRNHQDNWPWNVTERISGNYYPVTAFIYVQDVARNLQLSILTDRAEGGSSVNDGSVELMVHRRLLFDDGYGVNEALNEPGFDGRGLVVRGTHYLTIGAIREMAQVNKYLAKSIFHYPLVTFMRQNSTTSGNFLKRFRGLKHQLPPNIHILSLEKLSSDKILLRLEHFMEKSDHHEAIGPTAVALSSLFTGIRVVYFEETTLAANRFHYDVDKLKWTTEDSLLNDNELYDSPLNDMDNFVDDNDALGNDTLITDKLLDGNEEGVIFLNPMEIRTFILKVIYDPLV